jgi:hypothetical protein
MAALTLMFCLGRVPLPRTDENIGRLHRDQRVAQRPRIHQVGRDRLQSGNTGRRPPREPMNFPTLLHQMPRQRAANDAACADHQRPSCHHRFSSFKLTVADVAAAISMC